MNALSSLDIRILRHLGKRRISKGVTLVNDVQGIFVHLLNVYPWWQQAWSTASLRRRLDRLVVVGVLYRCNGDEHPLYGITSDGLDHLAHV